MKVANGSAALPGFASLPVVATWISAACPTATEKAARQKGRKFLNWIGGRRITLVGNTAHPQQDGSPKVLEKRSRIKSRLMGNVIRTGGNFIHTALQRVIHPNNQSPLNMTDVVPTELAGFCLDSKTSSTQRSNLGPRPKTARPCVCKDDRKKPVT